MLCLTKHFLYCLPQFTKKFFYSAHSSSQEVMNNVVIITAVRRVSVLFTVDTSDAGFGDLDVTVTQGGVGVPVKRHQASLELAHYSFTVKLPKPHLICISFNGETVTGRHVSVSFCRSQIAVVC